MFLRSAHLIPLKLCLVLHYAVIAVGTGGTVERHNFLARVVLVETAAEFIQSARREANAGKKAGTGWWQAEVGVTKNRLPQKIH